MVFADKHASPFLSLVVMFAVVVTDEWNLCLAVKGNPFPTEILNVFLVEVVMA